MKRLETEFFARDCLTVAPELVGKLLVRETPSGPISLRITETEAYRGEADTACHAHRGKTARNRLLWEAPGTVYIYLCYGVHWLLNAITGFEGEPQGVLIRACEGAGGPGKLTKALGLGKAVNGTSFVTSPELGIFDDGLRPELEQLPRVGIGYASPEDQARLWRFRLKK